MKIPRLLWVAICLATPLHAQQSEPPAASPPPLPSPPYVKPAPDSSQWLIVYAQGDADAKPDAKPTAHATPKDTRAGLAKKTVVVTKNPGIISETTALQNGAVTRRMRTPALFVTQLNGSSDWIPSTGGQNGFNETDYSKNEFAGFDWLSKKNYVGVQEIAHRPCFVFHDKVVTADPSELEIIRTGIERTRSNWEWDKEKQKTAASATPAKSKSKANDKQKTPAASPTPKPNDAAPPVFDIKDYMRDVTAYIDVETGLPAMLTYRTQERVFETRTYTFMPAPATPLTLPPETQALFDNQQARLKRLASSAGVP